MDDIETTTILVIAIAGTILLYWLRARIRAGRAVSFRPIRGYSALRTQSARAVEGGRNAHISLGSTSLVSESSPGSIAALTAMDFLTEDGVASDVPPLVTMGDGTLMIAAQDSLRGAFAKSGRKRDYDPSLGRFIAATDFSAAYAVGVSEVVNSEKLGSNLLLGRYGPELAIIAEAGERKKLQQVVGTDDPTAMSIALAATDNVLLGEELYVAGAYLKGEPAQVASLQLQDVLRGVAIAAILLAAIYNFVVS